MVLDTPDVPESTANSLLMLFGLESIHDAPVQEDEPLRIAGGSAETPLLMSCEIRGGQPIAFWGETPVASQIAVGRGTVTAECITIDADTEEVASGTLKMDSGETYELVPDEG